MSNSLNILKRNRNKVEHFDNKFCQVWWHHLQKRRGIEYTIVSFAQKQARMNKNKYRYQVYFQYVFGPLHNIIRQQLLLSILKFKFEQAMEQEEICELLKQIIPELEAKIREEIKNQYEIRIRQMQKYYQDEIQKFIQKQERLILEYQTKNGASLRNEKDIEELYSRIAILESQRKNWCSIQIQYQSTIQQLTTLLLKNPDKNSSQTQQKVFISSQGKKNQHFNSVSAVHPPPKSTYMEQKIYKANKKQKQNGQTKQLAQRLPRYTEQYSNINVIDESDIENSLTKYIKQNKNNTVSENQSSDHCRSVLSPPKQESSTKGKRIFWDDNKKKQLLSLIKLH